MLSLAGESSTPQWRKSARGQPKDCAKESTNRRNICLSSWDAGMAWAGREKRVTVSVGLWDDGF